MDGCKDATNTEKRQPSLHGVHRRRVSPVFGIQGFKLDNAQKTTSAQQP